MKFNEFNLDNRLLEAISYMGYDSATPIQEKVIPLIIKNRDLIACAQTGTGKTGAYVLPILDKLSGKEIQHTDTLIIVPTRELAVQVEQYIEGLSYFVSASAMAIYGGGDGRDWELQKAALINNTEIIIATPGKLLSYLKMGSFSFGNIQHLILDEADKMMDMGFVDDILAILSYLPQKRQTLMFSATMPDKIRRLARKILNDPVEISLSIAKPAEGVDQKVCMIADQQKVEMISFLLKERENYDSILIFTSTKSKVSEIVYSLRQSGLPAQGISSMLEQQEREEVLRKFRARQINILVATDVMSRGIDVKEINLVINYDVPHTAEDYVHRVGRTARVNATGEAITLVNHRDRLKMKKIEELIGKSVPVIQLPDYIARIHSPEKERPKTHSAHQNKFHRKKNNFHRKNNGR